MEFDLSIIHVKTSLLTTGTSESYAGKAAIPKDGKQAFQKNELHKTTETREIFKGR